MTRRQCIPARLHQYVNHDPPWPSLYLRAGFYSRKYGISTSFRPAREGFEYCDEVPVCLSAVYLKNDVACKVRTIFGRPLQVTEFALCYGTVVLSVLCPVSNVDILLPNGWMDQDATLYGGRSRPRRHCVRWGPTSPLERGTAGPHFSAHVTKRSSISATCHLWSWLGLPLTTVQYVMYFRFCGSRHVFTPLIRRLPTAMH